VNGAAGKPPRGSGGAGDRDPWVGLAGYLLLEKLSAVSALQDCVMSGRTNCAPITSPGN